MFQCSKFNRLVVAGIAAAAISPTPRSPARRSTVASRRRRRRTCARPTRSRVGAPGTGVVQDLRTPDQVDGTHVDRADAGRAADVARQPAADRERRADHQHAGG